MDDDDDDGLGDEHDEMSKDDVTELEESIVPIQLMLTKVSCFKLSFKLSNNGYMISYMHLQMQSRIHPP